MKFVMNRDKVIGGTYGHFIGFKKGVPMEVPKIMWEDVMAAGGVPESEITEEENYTPPVIVTTQEREDLYFKAFKAIIERNERGDFTASGLPNSKVLEKMLGFQVVNKERDTYWTKFMEPKDL
jgi:hypothetical protein